MTPFLLVSSCLTAERLLYHWTKYVKKSVSLIRHDAITNWGDATTTSKSCNTTLSPIIATSNGSVCQESILSGNFLNQYTCRRQKKNGGEGNTSPYQDFHHFTGLSKPWYSNQTLLEDDISKIAYPKLNVRQQWYYHLKHALVEIGMAEAVLSLGIIGTLDSNRQAPVGVASAPRQVCRYVQKKYELQHGVGRTVDCSTGLKLG
jgi:hypothetical protein